MMRNKKAQNITKPYVIILMIVVVALITVSFNEFGRDIASTPGNTLDNDSLNNIFSTAGFVPTTIKNTTNDTTELFFSSSNDTGGSTKDFTLQFQFYREKAGSIQTITRDLWNLPMFFINGVGLNTEDWGLVNDLLSTLIWLIIFYAVYRVITGSA